MLVMVDRGHDGGVPRHALHDHHLHAHGAARAEEEAGGAGGLQLLTGPDAGGHAYQYPLFAHPGAVGHEVVLENVHDHALLEGLSFPVDQGHLVHPVEGENRKAASSNSGMPQRRKQDLIFNSSQPFSQNGGSR